MKPSTAVVNNVNLERVAESVQSGQQDGTTLRKRVSVHGEWMLNSDSAFQFRTDLEYEKGTERIEIDSPSFLGGNGSRLGPTNYCLVGMASCFALTFAILAARQGVSLSKLAIDADCELNFGRYLDVSDEPVIEGVRFRVTAEAVDAAPEKLSAILRMAEERCPAVYMLVHPVRVQAELA